MKRIVKRPSEELEQFELWKSTWQLSKKDLLDNPLLDEQKNEIWKKLSGKDKINIKQALLNEQGFICCYCQQRIELDKKTIIEHFMARATNPAQMFDYENLFACCDGGDTERQYQNEQKIPKAQRIPQYCGSKKDDKEICINPLDENCETHFSYSFNPDSKEVLIEGLTSEGCDTISTLNLGIAKLKTLRGAEIAGYILDGEDYITVEEAEILLQKITQKRDGKFQPFCAALEHVLKTLVR